MKLSLIASTLALAATALAESHTVTLVNNCPSGNPVFLYQGNGPRGSGTIDGQVLGGVAWVDGFAGADCQSSGVNCGIVEFTLTNPDDPDNTQNAADYSLLTGDGLGNHQFTYRMNFAFTGSCSGVAAPGPCTGNSASECPGAFLGSDTEGGTPVQCVGADAGITITFC
ncbi:hypothetical protein VNI00_000450 [Paramarasmius palmivorus]|uniref:Thaumatin-like protein n=1 Tax=Paramarasmius palmivorus TaxID=297713 RepID=A0AAW0E9J0_9AGAR